MINDFMKQTIELLKRSDIKVRPTVIRPVKFNHEERDNSHMVYLYASDSFGNGGGIAKNFVLQVIIMFSVMDAYIDTKYPSLQGKSYRKKYEALSNTTDDEIILKEVFRLLKLLRNASVHSMNSITYNNNNVVVSFTHFNTNFCLDISKLGIDLLFTYVLDALRPAKELSSRHLECLNRKLYDQIKGEINAFTDEFGSGLMDISSDLRLKRHVRYYVENPKYTIENERVEIISIYGLEPSYEEHYGVDYLIEMDSRCYLLPEEVLSDNQISVVGLEQWLL